MKRAFRAAALLAIVLIVVGASYERWGARRDRARLPQVGRSIDIGARTLNLFCSGEGTPAVVFDAGAAEAGYAWSHIQPRIASLTRACWFDRAGHGWSDPGPFPRTSAAMSADLHALLRRAGIPPPYLLVGHSLGGLNVRVYNGLYPGEVAGAVLVDAAHEDEPRRAPAFMLGHSAPRWLWHPIWIAVHGAEALGLIRLVSPRVELAADPSHRTREQIVAALRAQPKTIAALADASTPDSYAQAERSGGFGDRPLVVLTRGRVPPPRANPSPQDLASAEYERVWMHDIQPKLARLSTHGRQVIVTTSGHGMPDEAPDAIVEAIRQVLGEIRGRSPGADGARRVSNEAAKPTEETKF